MKKYSLNGIWKMTGNGYTVEGKIPGSVYSFLYLDNHLPNMIFVIFNLFKSFIRKYKANAYAIDKAKVKIKL